MKSKYLHECMATVWGELGSLLSHLAIVKTPNRNFLK